MGLFKRFLKPQAPKYFEVLISGNSWTFKEHKALRVYVWGKAWFNEEFYSEEVFTQYICDKFRQNHNKKTFNEVVKECIPEKGQYAFVIISGDFLATAVDHIRSKPLFYTTYEGQVIVSDKANRIQRRAELYSIDATNKVEFKYLGAVTGKGTLLKKLFQVEPGVVMFADRNSSNDFCFDFFQHFKYWPESSSGTDTKLLLKELDGIVLRAFERLRQSSEGKTLVLPLSGGFDSRLIALSLKRFGFESVICFSYGKKGNKESRVSKKVAESLGFKWYFVRYDRKKWRDVLEKGRLKDYFKRADNFASLPHFDEFVAVGELLEGNKIPQDSIFIPGHTGDFISGGHIPPRVFKEKKWNDKKAIALIFTKYFRLWKFKNEEKAIRKELETRLQESLNAESVDSFLTASRLIELFDWKERQSKYIVNSVRVYEYWGCEWRLPLWDKELVCFFRDLDFSLKKNKYFYKQYFQTLNQTQCSSSKHLSRKEPSLLVKFLIFPKLVYHKIRLNFVSKFRFLFEYFFHPMQYFGICRYSEVLFKYYGYWNVLSIVVLKYFEWLDDRIAEELKN